MKRGFTLIEMLVVLGIIALVASAIGASLTCGIRTWDSARNFGDYEMNAAIALRIVEKDLVNLSQIKEVPFKGEAGRLSFPTRILPEQQQGVSGQEPVKQLGTAEYYVDSSAKILRRRIDTVLAESADGDKGEALARGVQSVSFGYLVLMDKDAKDATWLENWNDCTNMPISVRIELKLDDPGRTAIKRVVNIPARPEAGDL